MNREKKVKVHRVHKDEVQDKKLIKKEMKKMGMKHCATCRCGM